MMGSTLTSSEVTLRPATSADLDLILHHRREMFREMGGKYEEHLEEFEEASRQYFETALLDGGFYGLLAEFDGQTVAGGGIVIAAWPGSPVNFQPKRAWILNIYVEPTVRRKGLARKIMQALIAWCRQNDFRSVSLHPSEYGRELYETLGFCRTQEMRLLL